MRARVQDRDGDVLALELGHGVDAVLHEQLEAADMYPGQDRNRRAAIDCGDELRGVMHIEIDRIAGDRLVDLGARSGDETDVGKPLGAQKFLGNVLRGGANAAGAHHAQGRGFERLLRGRRLRLAQQASGSRQ